MTPTAETTDGFGARLAIDLGALARNYRTLAQRSEPAECGAVVKADAYGIGIEQAVTALYQAGCRTFFVATPEEGIRVRKTAWNAVIYVLNGPLGASGGPLVEHGLTPFLSSTRALRHWAAVAKALGRRLPFALNVDTGMTRLGLHPEQAAALAAEGLPEPLECSLLASHLASADTPEHPMNAAQLAAFREVRALFPDIPASLANSAGTLAGPDFHFDVVRPGIALYGARASAAHAPLATVVTLTGRIVQVREAKAGDTVGYGAAETLQRDSRIAIVSVGYADGYLRAAGGRDGAPGAPAFAGGERVRVVGRVSMDLTAIDVTDAPVYKVREGGWVELFGENVAIDEVAAAAGSIGYELLTGLSRRARRDYLTVSAGET